MSEFHDPDLRRELGRLSGPYPDDNEAFAAWQRRVRQVRRRRTVAWTTSAALALIVGTLAIAAAQSPGRHSVVPGKSADSSEVSVTVETTEAEDPSTTPDVTEPQTTEATTSVPETTPTSVVVDTSAPAVPEPEGSPANGSATNGRSGSPTTASSGGSQLVTQTFSSIGGSITVRNDGEHLTVIATNPAPGFEADDGDRSGERVGVTFKTDTHKSQISVTLSEGIMKPDVKESDDGDEHDSTVPDVSSDERDRDRSSDSDSDHG